MKADMFISMAYVILDHAHGGVTMARAGHDAPLLYKAKAQTIAPLKPPEWSWALTVETCSIG